MFSFSYKLYYEELQAKEREREKIEIIREEK
jgi:hypothetical protein